MADPSLQEQLQHYCRRHGKMREVYEVDGAERCFGAKCLDCDVPQVLRNLLQPQRSHVSHFGV